MAKQLSVIRILAALPLLVLAASCATMPPGRDDSADLAKELTGKVAEKPRSCISLDDARSAKIFDDAILYRTSRRLSYVNESKGCRAFDSDPIFIDEVRGGSQLCRGDVVRTVSRSGGVPVPFCVLGDFTPYRTPKTK